MRIASTISRRPACFAWRLFDSNPPFGFVDPKTNKIVGLDVDYAKAVADKLGVKLDIQPTNPAPLKHSLRVLQKKSRGMGSASTAFALGTSTLTCMLAAESRDGWIASKTRSPWVAAVNLKRLRGRSYG